MVRQNIHNPKQKVYTALQDITSYHFAPLTEGPSGKKFHLNPLLMALTYLLDKNHLLIGEPGWGKTTLAKIVAARLSGMSFDLYDALEIRGHPQKTEEKIAGRLHMGKLATGTEEVLWQGILGLDVVIVDEGNRLPYESQETLLQGLDTSRWNYLNASLYDGKKPTFITMNERTGTDQNGFLPALKDRLDMISELGYVTTFDIFDISEAKERIVRELCDPKGTRIALDAIAKDFQAFKKVIEKKPISGHLIKDEKAQAADEIRALDFDVDARLFLQAFIAELNYSNQYGRKRASDPISEDTHDKNHAGLHVTHSFSPRSQMAAIDYAKGLAWILGDRIVTLDHVKFILPFVYAHKAGFTDDYKNDHGNEPRKDCQDIHLAKILVEEVHNRYIQQINPMKAFILRVQRKELTSEDDAQLNPDLHDHPLMKDIVRYYLESKKSAFYDVRTDDDTSEG